MKRRLARTREGHIESYESERAKAGNINVKEGAGIHSLAIACFISVAALGLAEARAQDTVVKETAGLRVNAVAKSGTSKSKAGLTLSVQGCPGKFLSINRNKFELSSWKDDLGNPIGSKQYGKDKPLPGGGELTSIVGVKGSNFVNSKYPTTVSVRANQPMHKDAKKCTAKGSLTVRYATEEKIGEVKGIAMKVGKEFKLGDILFTVTDIKKRTLGGNTNYWMKIECNPKQLLKGEYLFVNKLELYDKNDTSRMKRQNQMNDSSKGGFFYLWVIPSIPAKVSIKYSYYLGVKETRVPFSVEAPVNRR